MSVGCTYNYNDIPDIHCRISGSCRVLGGKETYSKADLVFRITGLLTKACLRSVVWLSWGQEYFHVFCNKPLHAVLVELPLYIDANGAYQMG